jgi:segregation and condensation protein B
MNNLPLDAQIEALLFFKGEVVSYKTMAELLEVSIEEIETALASLEQNLLNRGLTLVHEDKSVMLGTAALASPLIEKIVKEEIMKDLGKAGLETLAIILYKQKVSKREIDYIRGVNSSFIIRNLLVRGLVERTDLQQGDRGYAYKPTTDLLAFMGLNRIEDLPEYSEMVGEIDAFTKKEGAEIENG